MPAPARLIGHIAQLWRYPVKSMAGERCPSLQLTSTGIFGDRLLAFSSADAPTGKPLLRAAQRAAMLRARSSFAPDNSVLVHLPDRGDPLAADAPPTPARLASALGLSPDTTLELVQSARPLTDVRPIAIHSTTTATSLAGELNEKCLPGMARGFDDRRLRSNLILAANPDCLAGILGISLADLPRFPEDALAGHRLRLGDHAQLQILERIPRCRIVALNPEPPPGRTPSPDPHLLRHLSLQHDGRAGIYARPLTPGLLREGDPVFLLD